MATKARRLEDEEESYFVSMTDLMVGLLFIFIIMLMFFALQYRQAEQQRQEATSQLVDSQDVRNAILDDLGRRLKERGVTVEIVKDEGILRLPEAILFDKSRAEINATGQKSIAVLADALDAVLPCYAQISGQPTSTTCPPRRATIESMYVEGHSDSDRLTPRIGLQDNLDLSAIRATNTFRLLISNKPSLLEFQNRNSFPVLSVSGYGEYRPVQKDQSTEAQKSMNRRIDLRILMAAPRLEDARRFENNLIQRVIGP